MKIQVSLDHFLKEKINAVWMGKEVFVPWECCPGGQMSLWNRGISLLCCSYIQPLLCSLLLLLQAFCCQQGGIWAAFSCCSDCLRSWLSQLHVFFPSHRICLQSYHSLEGCWPWLPTSTTSSCGVERRDRLLSDIVMIAQRKHSQTPEMLPVNVLGRFADILLTVSHSKGWHRANILIPL